MNNDKIKIQYKTLAEASLGIDGEHMWSGGWQYHIQQMKPITEDNKGRKMLKVMMMVKIVNNDKIRIQ